MTQPADTTIPVTKAAAVVPVAIQGTDAEGRTLITCPTCGDTATVLEDGLVSCPTDQGIVGYLRPRLANLTELA